MSEPAAARSGLDIPPQRETVANKGGGSLHEHIVGFVRDKIVSGAWSPGYRIASEHELTEQFACSRMTVNKALTQLAASGLIERRRKAGSFVSVPRARSAILQIPDIRSEVEALGLKYRFEIPARQVRALESADAARLDATPPARVLDLTVLHFGGAQPFCREDRLINLVEVPAAETEMFADVPPSAWLVAKVPWTDGEHRIRAEGADEAVAASLGLRRGAPCLVIERRTWRAGQPITHVRLTYPGSKQEMVAWFAPR